MVEEQLVRTISIPLREILALLNFDPHIRDQAGRIDICLQNSRILISFEDEGINCPVPALEKLHIDSGHEDVAVHIDQVASLMSALKRASPVVCFNHLGCCYSVPSQTSERKLLTDQVAQTDWHLYEMQSTDEALWLFVGDATDQTDPLIEFLPIEHAYERWGVHWLPHVHIDVTTHLTGEQIKRFVWTAFAGTREAQVTVAIEGIVCQLRVWLGVVAGIEILLDIGTRARDTDFNRSDLLKQLA
jgi:hypothetical protein